MKKFTLEEIFNEVVVPDSMPKGSKDKMYKEIGGCKIKINSHRLANFKANGVVCASCFKEGTHFKEHNNYNGDDSTFNINLFTEDGTMMTTSKVEGYEAMSFIDRFITLCEPCNIKYKPHERVMFKDGEIL